MSDDKDALRASNLTKTFGSIVAVDDISFSVGKGEIFGFLGPNGAGKTTTVRMLTGILRPDKGNISIGGIDVEKEPIQAKMGIGVVPEVGNVYVDLTAGQNLSLTGRYYGLSKNIIEIKTEDILTCLGLYDRRNDLVRTFSKGMKQRISIACAIINDPHVLFLDEPTEGLDVQSKRLMVDTIHGMNEKGCTIFLTTHNMYIAEELCDRVAFIIDGEIKLIDSPKNLKLQYGHKLVDIEYTEGGKIVKETLKTADAAGRKHIGEIIENHEIQTMHTKEATLEEILIQVTGRELVYNEAA